MLPITSCGSLSRALCKSNFHREPSIARPCTQVRILPFHPISYLIDYSRRNPSAFAFGVTARTSIFTYDGCYPLPGSKPKLGRVRTFLLTTYAVRRSSCFFIITQNYIFGRVTVESLVIPCFFTNPSTASTTYMAGLSGTNIAGKLSGAAPSTICTIDPVSSNQIMSSE